MCRTEYRRGDTLGVGQVKALFLQQSGDPAACQKLALQALENLRQQRASALTNFDCFCLFAVTTLVLMLLVLMMKRSVTEKQAHIQAE